MPRYELLAVPHGDPDSIANANQYQTFTFLKELKGPEDFNGNSFSGNKIGHPHGTTMSAPVWPKAQERLEESEQRSGFYKEHGERRVSFLERRYTSVHIPITSGHLPVNSRSTPVYLRLNPGRHPDYDRMTSGYHPFISVFFRLYVPVFSGTFRLLLDFIRPFDR
ncbi:hypothetical protein K438DRAFT_1967627 [Mycena galopus ATCC 62051]|nr:hypothetical protein K438DRAFT_1967627 [Mycena galopus ATCC 62051]